MKNKRNSERDDYRLLKNKLLIRIFGMLFFAFAFLAALYSLFLKGHIADTFVGFWIILSTMIMTELIMYIQYILEII